MKSVLNFSVVALLAIVVLAGCTKYRDHFDDRNYNEDAIVYKHDYSPWVILSFSNGDYAVMKSLEAGQDRWPEEGDVLRGNFDNTGSRLFRNVTMNYNFNGLIAAFQSNLDDAIDDWDYYASKDGWPSASAVSRTKDFTPMARSKNTTPVK